MQPVMTTSEPRFRPSGRVVIRRIGGDNLLVPVSGGTAGQCAIFPVNETGLFVWEQLSSGHSLQQAADALCSRYEVAPAQALADCCELAENLINQQLIEPEALKPGEQPTRSSTLPPFHPSTLPTA